MKKLITLFTFMVLFIGVKAQFSENFDAVAEDSMPTGWTVFNLDGHTPYSGLISTATPWDKAWGCYDLAADGFNISYTSKCAWATSYFTPAGTANRWMFTPAITVPATNPVIQYTVYDPDASYPDSYELRIMTTAPTSGNITTSTVLLSVAAAPAPDPKTMSVNLSAYAGQTVYIGWRVKSTDMDIIGIDNVVVKSLPNIDATLSSINNAPYVVSGNTNITGTITNSGANAITSFDVTYSVDGGTASAVYSVTGQNIASMATYNFTHNVPANITIGQHTVQVTISNVNAGTDANTADNVLTKTINGVSSIPTKRVFCEEETSVLCGYCVRGIVFMDSIAKVHPTDWIGVACHSTGMGTDPMVVTAWDNGNCAFPGFTGFPSVIVDRTILDDPSNLFADYATQKAVISPVDVALANVTYNSTTKQISFDVKATPVTTGTVDWRINGAIYEMDVTASQDPGTSASEYNQDNYYSGGSIGAMGGFENLANPVPAAQMHYNYIGRAILGGYAGTASSIPASITDGTIYTQNYTYTVPTNQDATQMYVVGLVIDQTSGKVLNSIQAPISPAGITEQNSNNYKMYPNPSKGIIYFDGLNNNSQITVTNILGESLMFVENVKSIDLSNYVNGIYFVKIKSGNNVSTEKIILNK